MAGIGDYLRLKGLANIVTGLESNYHAGSPLRVVKRRRDKGQQREMYLWLELSQLLFPFQG